MPDRHHDPAVGTQIPSHALAAPAFLSLISGLQINAALGVLAKHYGIRDLRERQ